MSTHRIQFHDKMFFLELSDEFHRDSEMSLNHPR